MVFCLPCQGLAFGWCEVRVGGVGSFVPARDPLDEWSVCCPPRSLAPSGLAGGEWLFSGSISYVASTCAVARHDWEPGEVASGRARSYTDPDRPCSPVRPWAGSTRMTRQSLDGWAKNQVTCSPPSPNVPAEPLRDTHSASRQPDSRAGPADGPVAVERPTRWSGHLGHLATGSARSTGRGISSFTSSGGEVVEALPQGDPLIRVDECHHRAGLDRRPFQGHVQLPGAVAREQGGAQ